ncbi:MAG: response regulator transcription factor [Patescibacteria group bacterium]|jgi:DNA-binding response OmpR family regulator
MRILIIEDNEKLAFSLKKGLEQDGNTINYVLDGEAGEQCLLTQYQNYDVVILDIMLPKRNGLDICKTIRKQGITVPILILTAKDDVADKITGLDYGADDYLVKPFAFAELVARLKALHRRPIASTPVILSAGILTVNTTTHQVHCAKQELTLTLKEYRLLVYLLQHLNEVIAREQLWQTLWKNSTDTISNVLEAQIKNLRKKIAPYGLEKNLETIRGLGYRFKA